MIFVCVFAHAGMHAAMKGLLNVQHMYTRFAVLHPCGVTQRGQVTRGPPAPLFHLPLLFWCYYYKPAGTELSMF